MKRLLTILIAIMCLFGAFTLSSCDGESESIEIAIVDGAPTLAVYNALKEKGQIGGYNVNFKILSGAENIATVITSGQADVAVMPTNISAKLYNNGVDIKLASVNIFGVLYMIGSQPITQLTDLNGKIIAYVGAGGTPELTIKLILDRNAVAYERSAEKIEGKVALTPISSASEAMTLLKTKKVDYAIVSEPVVTQINSKLGTSVVLDLQEEWSKIIGEKSYMQAGVVLSHSVYNKGVFVRGLMEVLENNSSVLLKDYANVKQTLIDAGSSIRVDFTEDTIKRLNIGHLSAVGAKPSLEKYYNALLEYDPKLIGGKLPDDNFYLGYEK